jgi:hypothetical protein
MQVASIATQVKMAFNSNATYSTGWCPSPVPAASVVNVVAETTNPQDTSGGWWNIPEFIGIATQTGPTTPNGVLLFGSRGGLDATPLNGTYGVVVWYAE